MVVQQNERNIADQQALLEELFTSHSIYTHSVTLKQLKEWSRLEGSDYDVNGGREGGTKEGIGEIARKRGKKLVLRLPSGEEKVVSVVYYRAGYTPEDYEWEEGKNESNGEGEVGGRAGPGWEVREMIERSEAIKCPTIGYQLAGTKRIQQVLSMEGQLEKFLTPEESKLLRKTFAKQYSLGTLSSPECPPPISSAIADGSHWVLKPQREGGGNNKFGAELSNFLLENKENDELLSGYVLMQRIFPR